MLETKNIFSFDACTFDYERYLKGYIFVYQEVALDSFSDERLMYILEVLSMTMDGHHCIWPSGRKKM